MFLGWHKAALPRTMQLNLNSLAVRSLLEGFPAKSGPRSVLGLGPANQQRSVVAESLGPIHVMMSTIGPAPT